MKGKIPGNQINISENNGIKLVWDIDFIISEIKGSGTKALSVDMLYNEKDQVNKTYAMQTDLQLPIIVAKLSNEEFEIVDGKHRLYKAKMTGIKEIDSYCIEPSDLFKYLTEDKETIKAYLDQEKEK